MIDPTIWNEVVVTPQEGALHSTSKNSVWLPVMLRGGRSWLKKGTRGWISEQSSWKDFEGHYDYGFCRDGDASLSFVGERCAGRRITKNRHIKGGVADPWVMVVQKPQFSGHYHNGLIFDHFGIGSAQIMLEP